MYHVVHMYTINLSPFCAQPGLILRLSQPPVFGSFQYANIEGLEDFVMCDNLRYRERVKQTGVVPDHYSSQINA